VSEQLDLEFDDARITDGPHPCGLREFELKGDRYLVDFGVEDSRRVLGWYYGYPTCCVEAFISGKAPRPLQLHPITGHVLCGGCATGSLAHLARRPAEKYGLILWLEDSQPALVYPPSTYDGSSTRAS
jgi:hypothetical protein